MDIFFEGYTLGLEVLKHESGTYESGEGNTIYYKILNQTSKKVKIIVDEIYIINNNNGQFNKDVWLSGFVIEDNTSIIPGAFRKAGAIFLKSVGGDITTNCRTGIVVKDETSGYQYDAIFILQKNNKWKLLSCDVSEYENVPEKQIVQKRLKNSIERIEAFEEKLGVRLDNISVITNSDFDTLQIMGEIFLLEDYIKENICRIKINLYNAEGDIIYNTSTDIHRNDFKGYDTFNIYIYEDNIALDTDKIRVYTV